ncbi:hypothetical protein HanXRQr2_Chr01g0040161 [Helianthus annuus]|uniref:Uncharacterized protein n=1 Tax=Helianthus annuus TaxID=4232 RepID=A0A9K3JYI1_HELAN|nr:hypothetical protein HanXRQr2_Chr01g0040161 [Helianthus annuus]
MKACLKMARNGILVGSYVGPVRPVCCEIMYLSFEVSVIIVWLCLVGFKVRIVSYSPSGVSHSTYLALDDDDDDGHYFFIC